MSRGGSIEAAVRAAEGARGILRRFVRWQTPFSAVSSLIPLVLVMVFLSDLLVGHPRIDRLNVVMWLSVFQLLGVIPLLLGRRYPLRAGFMMVVVMEIWSSYFLLFSGHGHAQVNALLELPLVALYVAWFYPAAVAWTFITLSTLRVWGTLVWRPDTADDLGSPTIMIGYAVLIMLFCFEGARAVRRQLLAQANTDPLTRALNRRGLVDAGGRVIRRGRRAGGPLAVAVVDFDDFKRVNDAGGHAAGDTALRESVRQWAEMIDMRGGFGGGGGFVARLGGDEFAIVALCSAVELEARLARVHRLSSFAWSWGVTRVTPDESLEDAIARADDELYRARTARRSD